MCEVSDLEDALKECLCSRKSYGQSIRGDFGWGWKYGITSMQPEIDALKTERERNLATISIRDGVIKRLQDEVMDANDACRMCETIADNLRAESDGWQNRYDLKCVEFDKMQEYYEIREDMQFATTEENAALRAVNKEIRKHVVAYQQAWDSKDLHNRISQIVFEKSYGEEFESAFRKLQEENAALQSRIAQLEASAAPLPASRTGRYATGSGQYVGSYAGVRCKYIAAVHRSK